mmetsp:Transcript_8700/g.21072  ORF Transcript_8700/g.21072 Transcript_8700/m.21072 type:complete len:374 (+) Transcript_8700:1415-2536(+)
MQQGDPAFSWQQARCRSRYRPLPLQQLRRSPPVASPSCSSSSSRVHSAQPRFFPLLRLRQAIPRQLLPSDSGWTPRQVVAPLLCQPFFSLPSSLSSPALGRLHLLLRKAFRSSSSSHRPRPARLRAPPACVSSREPSSCWPFLPPLRPPAPLQQKMVLLLILQRRFVVRRWCYRADRRRRRDLKLRERLSPSVSASLGRPVPSSSSRPLDSNSRPLLATAAHPHHPPHRPRFPSPRHRPLQRQSSAAPARRRPDLSSRPSSSSWLLTWPLRQQELSTSSFLLRGPVRGLSLSHLRLLLQFALWPLVLLPPPVRRGRLRPAISSTSSRSSSSQLVAPRPPFQSCLHLPFRSPPRSRSARAVADHDPQYLLLVYF